MSQGEDRQSLRSVARVVLPLDSDVDVLPLYVDGAVVPQLDDDGRPYSHPSSTEQVDQVLGRHSYRLRPGHHTSFGTYFNAFPAGYWRRWTTVEQVTLRIRTEGTGSLVVHRSNARGTAARVAARRLDGASENLVDLPLDGFGDGGWYWFDLIAGQDELVLEEADWLVPEPGRPRGTVTLGITTFNRTASCVALLEQLAVALGGEGELTGRVDEVLVIDQGTRRVSHEPGFADLAAALAGRIRLIEQANVGGSGGFSRSMVETLDAGCSDYLMLLDDDVVCEPEGIARAASFADFTRRPTVVGGHMFSMYERSTLHAFSEVVLPWQFRWGPAEPTTHDHDLSRCNLRATPWMHRRVDADYNGWWMCLIPVEVLRKVGLSLPFFIKWDDAEFGLRASTAGYPTVSLPGAAVWHVPWTDKDDSVDWQAYFHARNRFIAALLHSPFEHGGRMVRESLFIQLKHVLAMQYSAAALRQQALLDVLRGPEALHESLGTKLREVHRLRSEHPDATVRPDPEAFEPIRRLRARKRETPTARPSGPLTTILAAAKGVLHQVKPVPQSAQAHPERHVPAVDAGWWSLSRFDSALVSTTDGTGVSWLRRDRAAAVAAMQEALAAHEALLREWPRLAARYRQQLPDLVGVDRWRETLGMRRDSARPGAGER
ncbi:MAG TPA: glycosyltransferase [Intrasporangium sp.]|nr:glycosyltransferase [Intrasporangium sp.]